MRDIAVAIVLAGFLVAMSIAITGRWRIAVGGASSYVTVVDTWTGATTLRQLPIEREAR